MTEEQAIKELIETRNMLKDALGDDAERSCYIEAAKIMYAVKLSLFKFIRFSEVDKRGFTLSSTCPLCWKYYDYINCDGCPLASPKTECCKEWHDLRDALSLGDEWEFDRCLIVLAEKIWNL